MNTVESRITEQQLSSESILLYQIEEKKHQIINPILYRNKNGLPLDPDRHISVLVASDGKDNGEFLSLFIDGNWGNRKGKIRNYKHAVCPDQALQTWVWLTDPGFMAGTATLQREIDEICDAFDSGFMPEYEFNIKWNEKESEVLNFSMSYILTNKEQILTNLLGGLELTYELTQF